jgi:sec-independent protein translocase protein TatB
MFDVGFSELVLLFVIGLLVLGPQRLPKVAAQLGRWVGKARRTAQQLRRQLEREVELSDVVQPPKSPFQRPPDTPSPPQAGSPAQPPDGSTTAPPPDGSTATAPPPASQTAEPADQPPRV